MNENENKKELQIINEQEVLGKKFKVYGTFENPLFLAKDVAEWIDYAFKDSRKVHRDVSKMLKTVDEDEKIKSTMKLGGEDYSHGGVRENTEMWFLTEDGLYEVLMQSRKPIAKEFKKEVKKILKALRTGQAKLVPQLSAEDRAIVEIIHQVKAGNVPHAVGTVLEYGQEKYDEGYDNGQTDKAMELKPALDYMEIMDEKADGFMLVREAAKIVYTKDKIEVGERKLHAVLRHWGWEFIGRSNTEPSQFAIKNGWLIAQPYTHYDKASDRYYVSYTSHVTVKGLSQIAKKLLKMSIEEVNEIYKKDKAKIAKKER